MYSTDDYNLNMITPYFNVLDESYTPYKIGFINQKTTVFANNPLTLKMRIENAQGDKIGNSHYSNMECMISVSFVNKTFTDYDGGLFLESTKAHLGGRNVSKLWSSDEVMFVPFTHGTAEAIVQIEEAHEQIDLNITLKQSTYNYKSYPDIGLRQNSLKVTKSFTNFTYKYDTNLDGFSAVNILKITVKEQIPEELRIVPGYTLNPMQTLYFPIEPALQVELVDAQGYRITSGVNSELTVTTIKATTSTVLSIDSSFKLIKGVGTFDGSVVVPNLQAALKFRVTLSNGTVLSSGKTTSFVVNNKYVGVMHDASRDRNLYSFVHERTYDYDAYLTKVLGTRKRSLIFYIQDNEFGEVSLQPFTHKGINSADDIRDVIDNHVKNYIYWHGGKYVTWDISSNFQQAPKIKYIALIGSDDTNTEKYAAMAASYGLITVSDASISDKFSDKKKYPLLIRLAFSDEYKFTIITNFLKSREWTYVIIITGKKQAIPATFSAKLIHFNIKFYSITFPSTNKADGTPGEPTTDDVNDFFQSITQSDIKVLISLLSGAELTYMVDECTKREYTGNNGYTWIADGGMLSKDSPFYVVDRKRKEERLKAFNGAFVFESYYEDFNLENDAFTRIYKSGMSFHLDKTLRNRYFMMYDASSLVRDSLIRAQLKKETITPKKLLKLMMSYREKLHVLNAGISEDLVEKNILGTNITFDENYDRSNYTARLSQIHSEDPSDFLKSKRLLLLGDKTTVKNILPQNSLKEFKFKNREIQYTSSSHQVSISIKSAAYRIDEKSKLWKNEDEDIVKEDVPLSFYCTEGCGGERINATSWKNGKCIWNYGSKCQCNNGYIGDDCSAPVCEGCQHYMGECVRPGKCICKSGYRDNITNDCSIFHCDTYGCVHGNCTSGDNCVCERYFYGRNCKEKCSCDHDGICDDTNVGTGACDCRLTGYFGQKCTYPTVIVIVLASAGGLAIIILLILGVRHKTRKMIELDFLMNTDWKANWDEIRMRQTNQKSSVKSVLSMMSMISARSGKGDGKVFCQNQGHWNGREIVVKIIRKEKLDLSPELRVEIKQIREMHHPNLCLFIGACLESPHICILNEVCGKGSLEDILANDDISLGWDFRYSMLKDICRGMTYLANSEIGSHGRLKSSNCLVDNRWCVKISDFGLKNFKADQYGIRVFAPENGVGVELPDAKEIEGCDYYNLLWTAPEIIATGVSHLNHVAYGSSAGDIYSFSIIMVEMCTRQHPYHELSHLRSDELVQMIGRLIENCNSAKLVESRDIEDIPIFVIRPQINEDDLPDNVEQAEGLLTLIETCWNHDPLCRPDFATCGKCLNRISPHRGELMDNLIVLMEQYTSSLEAIVAERTANIAEEKAKIDLLLSKMLPPLIAEELKSGKNPKPEYFNNVTIYFSDVVGFGNICSKATPFQVVEILNGLYSVMDNVIDSFDCYKVETIADCYMVASGLPVRNGDKHAGEIASMALELLQSFNGVSYVGYDDKQVQLRIGIHSGPVVAGVVGMKMPRYCLFGDTVNTSSRMESGGFALKIHLSEDTYKVLEKLGGYIVTCRGEIPVKGRGVMTTYWLKGKVGMEYRLPTEDMALSASQHYFK